MELFIKKRIGREVHTFKVSGNTFFTTIMEAQKLSFRDVPKCGICDKDNLYLRAYITKEKKYEYVKVVCADCKASLTFGKRADVKDTYYLRRNDTGLDWKAYEEKKEEVKEDNSEIQF